MSAGLDVAVDRRVLPVPAARQRQSERWFFGGMAVASALGVFVGFAPTYYLKGVFGTPPLSPLVHLHGALSTAWMLLFVAQTSLVAARRTDLHRRLGIVGLLLVVAIAIVGPMVAITATRRGFGPTVPQSLALENLFTPLGGLSVFVILALAGLAMRRKRDTHKRLMMLAALSILPAGLDRTVFPGGALAFLGLPNAIPTFVALLFPFVLACWLYDLKTRGRVHPAFLWGGVVVLLEVALRSVIGRTAAWQAFAGWLTS